MKITNNLKAAAIGFIQGTAKNSMLEGSDLARRFMRYGSSNMPLVEDWSKVIINDSELYTGYPYAAINNRANRVVKLAKSNLRTDALPTMMKKARAASDTITHPYLDLINLSPTFTNTQFWYNISTYLDLEGIYYILAIRNTSSKGITTDSGNDEEGNSSTTRVGDVQEFKLLNPYNIHRIRNKVSLEVGGYIETRDGMVREIPPEMIIEIRKLNPFSEDDPFSMTDAAKEAQYTLKQSGDYTRHSLKNNMSSPGIISTDVLLDPQQFANFVNRVTNQEKGLPLFGNGAGAISWDDMQIDLDKASLSNINEINRQTLFAVTGVGKTMMSIEESGTTRDTATAQQDIFVENHAVPQLQLIIDALNQDYKNYYPDEYKKSEYEICIEDPIGRSGTEEIQDIQIRSDTYTLYDSLVADGYDRDLAAKFAEGEIGLEELGKPANDPRPNPIAEAMAAKTSTPPSSANKTLSADKPKDKTPPEAPPINNELHLERLNYLEKNGISKFVQKYDGELTRDELKVYVEVV